MDALDRPHRPSAARGSGLIVLVSISVLIGFVFAFYLGRLTATRPVPVGPDGQPIVSAEQSADPGSLLEQSERAVQTGELQKQIDALKKEVGELQAERKELSSKLSVAADTVNRLTRSVQEERRRAEEAEWRSKQAEMPGAGR
jgi:hypothetical protein